MPSKEKLTDELIQAAKNFFAEGNLPRAEAVCRELIKIDPENAEACHLLGIIADRKGEPELAIRMIAEAIRQRPYSASYYNNLGNAYCSLTKFNEAVAAFQNAIRINPAFAEAHYNLGNALRETGSLADAAASFKKAIYFKPDLAAPYFGLGQALKGLGFTGAAIEGFEQAVRLRNNYPQAHYQLGLALIEEGRCREAGTHFARALHFRPDFPDACYSLANAYADMDEPGAALATYERLLQMKPDFYKAYSHISSLVNQRTPEPYYSPGHADIKHVRQFLESKQLTAEDTMDLHFALGDMHDNCDLFDEAFRHYRQGNLLKHAQSDFQPGKTQEYMESIINRFDRTFFQRHGLSGSSSTLPVFIVGLPRSGKSMAEKLMNIHHGLSAGGELIKLHRLITVDLPMKLGVKKKFPDFSAALDQGVLLEIAQDYEKTLLKLAAPGARRVTDTLPYNGFYLGIIAVMFPRSRVVYCRREPLDNCLAIYCKHFGRGNQYASSLEEIGIFYRMFEKLMVHWKKVLPLSVFELDYNKMVVEPEDTAKGLIRFLGLDWDNGCSAELSRLMAKAGSGRDGLYFQNFHTRFIGRAKSYKKFLGPLERTLAGNANA